MSPEVQAAIIKVAGDWAAAIHNRYSAPKKPEELGERLRQSFELCYQAVSQIVESK